MLPPPDSLTDPLLWADWLEIQAITSPDRNSSSGDLESALRPLSVIELDTDEAIEQKIRDVFAEIELRGKAAADAYPFDLDYETSAVIELRANWEEFAAYTFCLFVSYCGCQTFPSESINPTQLFEELSCLAAKRYLHGDAIGFGAPRTQLPTAFSAAIEELCRLIGEGEGFRQQDSLHKQDDKVDLVAWSDFPDKLPSKLMLFGQCAAGKGWKEKVFELPNPKEWTGIWMRKPLTSPAVKSFFIPHRLSRSSWEHDSTFAGVFFDRCRIARWAHDSGTDLGRHATWVKALLAQHDA
jgi:hypothetical protein